MKGKDLGLGLAMAGLMSAPVLAGYLVDNGSLPIGSGRTVSGPNIAGGWTVFQPFTVTDAAGWHVNTIGVDGWLVLNPFDNDMLGTLLPDDGFGNPDEGSPVMKMVFDMTNTDANTSAWVDVIFDVDIGMGDYWMKWEDNGDPDYWAAIYNAPMGENSFSRRDDGEVFPSGPTALRIDGTIIPGPASMAVLGLALAGVRRRRH